MVIVGSARLVVGGIDTHRDSNVAAEEPALTRVAHHWSARNTGNNTLTTHRSIVRSERVGRTRDPSFCTRSSACAFRAVASARYRQIWRGRRRRPVSDHC